MQHYCDARINLRRAIVSICPLLAILAPPALISAQPPTVQRLATEQTDVPPMAHVAGLLAKPAPDFIVMTLDGKEVSLADYKGKTLLVNFWATWCGACRLEMPWLVQLREQYANRGFEIVGIVTDGATDEKVRQISDKYGVKYRLVRCNHKTAQAYGGLPYLPESFYIDRHGRVVLETADAASKEEIETNIRKALGLGAR